MIQAIIFDCFGVLAESSYDRFYTTYLPNKPEVVAQIKALDHASNEGNITLDDFYRGIAELTSLSEPEIRTFMNERPANLELFAYISNVLKPDYKIGFVSNVATNLMDELFTKEQQSVFDDVVLSYAVNLVKPDVAIFKLAAKRLGVSASDCVFVDDVRSFLEGASLAGMETILYTDFPQFKAELEKLLSRSGA